MGLRTTGLATILLLTAPSCAARAAPAGTEAEVVRVVDGDTIVVERHGKREKVRLLGIDTPEISYGSLTAQLDRLADHTPETDRAELQAAIAVVRRHADLAGERARGARAALTDILGERSVILVFDSEQPERDRYGRLLVYVEIDGLDAGSELVHRGFAIADERYTCARLDTYMSIQSGGRSRPEVNAE